jgi:hypothetical protein
MVVVDAIIVNSRHQVESPSRVTQLGSYPPSEIDPTAASAVAIGVTLVLMLLIARVTGLEEFTGF